ncbi:type III-A CRISPR-associated protein Cas10/Csm1 [Thermosipho ferrireducens]|uniref:CRISPR system single-strand-specific deoxyribonuclease Cas10/Csm1 (subtype III-A) n=2 Tax=Thermosipho ferrireducens TaxID=2571116 RepID=A0ABX7SBA1_9BACT|nr:type III-A CRISPR-associated protein Cas10/Csm1 [Thermosipho ferrireducens]
MGILSTETIFLAGIFHDIGKFYQRTKNSKIKKEILKEYEYFIKQDNAFSPRHQEWGAYFYKNSNLPFKDEVEAAILNHHKPNNILSRLIRIADRVSSSEREDIENEEKIKNMVSILSEVKLKRNSSNPKYKKITKLSKFTDLIENEEENVENSYRKLWEEFSQLIVNEDDFERMYYILKEYTSNIPSAFYYSKPDISLFSHLTTTAAIAVGLFKQFEEDLKNNNEKPLDLLEQYLVNDLNDEKVLGFVKGDISGIQNFIYNISQEGAVKKLRGRSFYVSYLMEIIARYIVEKEGLTISNILFNGGGHFYLIVPAKTINNLRKYQEYIDRVMYEAHGLELSVHLGGVKLGLNELTGEIFQKVSEELEKRKNRNYDTIIEKIFNEKFKKLNEFSCPYCRRDTNEAGICSFCESFAELGQELSKSKYLRFKTFNSKIEQIDSYRKVFNKFGYDIEFPKNASKDAYLIEKVGEINLKTAKYYLKTANYVCKLENNNVSDLETIASSSKGLKRWGVLRGDVDNLGTIFHKGLGEKAPISKIATLSSELEEFFGKFLEDIVSQKYKHSSVIYSGGDDFFILGPWSELIPLAEDLNMSFKRYCGKNPDLSISMAIDIAPAKKFPVYRVASSAGDYLDKAKEYKRKDLEKSALYFLGDVIGWEEFEEYKNMKEMLFDIVTDKKVTKSILFVLRKMYEDSKKSKDIFKVWRLFYYLTRLKERYKNAKESIDNLIHSNTFLRNGNRLYEKLGSVTLWVEYETKEGYYEW